MTPLDRFYDNRPWVMISQNHTGDLTADSSHPSRQLSPVQIFVTSWMTNDNPSSWQRQYLENQFENRGTPWDDDTVPGSTDNIFIVLVIFCKELTLYHHCNRQKYRGEMHIFQFSPQPDLAWLARLRPNARNVSAQAFIGPRQIITRQFLRLPLENSVKGKNSAGSE